MAKEFYVQDKRSYVGNCMTWWKKDDCGYVCDIREARVFTQDEINEMDSTKEGGNKRAWPKKYIDQQIIHHIDMQDCEIEQALKV